MMNTETTLEKKPTWWIKFREDSGKILQLSAKEIVSNNPTQLVSTTHNELCIDIIKGSLSVKDCSMIWDMETESWELDRKSDVLVLTHNSNFLYQIKNNVPSSVDMMIRIYKNQNIVELSVNLFNIKKSMNLASINDIANKDNTLLNLFFTKRNDPDYLIHSVEVDPIMLFKRPAIRFKLDPGMSWDDISVFTRPIFNDYGLERLENFVSNVNIDNKNRILQTTRNSESDAHLYISVNEKYINVRSEIEQDYLINAYKTIRFIVCDTTPDNLIGGFEVSTKELLKNSTVNVKMGFKMPTNPLFIYKNKDIAVNYIGDNNG